MLKRGRAEPSRSLRPNIRLMFGVNRWNRTSVHLYWTQVNLAHPSFWSDGNADKGSSLPQQPLMSRTVRRSLRSCGFTRWKIRTARCVSWCRQMFSWKMDDTKSTNQVVVRQSRKVYIWRKLQGLTKCLASGKCLSGCVMFWSCICYQAGDTLVPTDKFRLL